MIRALATALALIPIGSGQHLYLSCKGTGSPTVVFESGLGVYSGTWLAVQQRVAKKTRACIYDRRGLGTSSPAPPDRTSTDMVRDLATLLHVLFPQIVASGSEVFVLAARSSHRIAELQPALVASEIVHVVTEARH